LVRGHRLWDADVRGDLAKGEMNQSAWWSVRTVMRSNVAPAGPLDRAAEPLVLRRLARDGHLSSAQLDDALVRLRAARGETWTAFADKVLLGVAIALLVAGVVFFFAANWEGLSRLTRMGLALAAHVIAASAAVWLGTERAAGRAAAAGAALLIGPVLLVFGQTYQTGADAWQLFVGWAVLSVPFALLVQGTALWLIVTILARIGALLWVDQSNGNERFMVAAIVLVDVFCARIARKHPRTETGIVITSLITLALPLIHATENARSVFRRLVSGDADPGLTQFFVSDDFVLIVVGAAVMLGSLVVAVKRRHVLHTTLYAAPLAAQRVFFLFGVLDGIADHSLLLAVTGALLIVEGTLFAFLITFVLKRRVVEDLDAVA
jgi:hypothetical protein